MKVLVADDNISTVEALCDLIKEMGHAADACYDGEQAVTKAKASHYDLIITDLRMPKLNGMEVLKTIKSHSPKTAIIVVTAFGSIDSAVEAMKEGAFDFVTKPYSIDEIEIKISKALALAEMTEKMERLSVENAYLRQLDSERFNYHEIIGNSESIRAIFSFIEKVSLSNSSVLILGESGTGKEIVARAIHSASSRKDGPFVKVHCAAYAPGVLESEMFGHERGAFTGAIKAKAGRFEQAHAGTLFLDEIGEIDPSIQVKLLRFLQDKEFERVGGTKTLSVDVRIICATNKDLAAAVTAGKFREDLYYRINVISVTVPPLRDRPGDIQLLANHFLKKYAKETAKNIIGIHPNAMNVLLAYPWPGNVRELQNVIERACVLSTEGEMTLDMLPPNLNIGRTAGIQMPTGSDGLTLDAAIEQFERQIIETAYHQAHGVKAKAANMLGIERNRLRYKLNKYGIE